MKSFVNWWWCGVCVAIGCQAANEYIPPPPPPVKVASPRVQDVTQYLEATGNTVAVESVEIRPQVTGYLEKRFFEPGQEVTAGQVLFEIDKRLFQAEVDLADAAVAVAEAEKVDAKAKYDRAVPLAEKGAVTEEELVEKAAIYNVALAKVEAAEARLQQAKLELEFCDVRSPIDGRVGAHEFDLGNLVGGPNATRLTTVIKYDPIFVLFNISEADLIKLINDSPRRENREIDKEAVKFYMGLSNEDDYPREGHLDFADLGVESSTGTFQVRAVFPNPQRTITPGMFVRIRYPVSVRQNAIVVPQQAIGADQAGRFVLTVDSENKVQRRNVKAGHKFGQLQVIEEGLDSNARIIVEGLQRAREGQPVTIVGNEPGDDTRLSST